MEKKDMMDFFQQSGTDEEVDFLPFYPKKILPRVKK
jgi:hypothetical protein